MQTNFGNEPMKFINFDTYEVVKRLCASGMPEKQAEEVIHAIISSKEYDFSKLATKEQVTDIQRELEKFATKEQITELQQEISGIRKDMELDKVSNNNQFDSIRKDMEKFATKEELFAMENKMVKEISKSKDDIVKWMVGLFIALAIAIFVKPYIH